MRLAIFLSLVIGLALLATAGLSASGQLPSQDETATKAERRAHFNYQMFCQGCHVADGSGHKSVPELKGFIHHFLASQQGREYLIRVPGAANSALDDAQLAEVMNWMLNNFGDTASMQKWRPYTSDEVAKYRKHPLNETVKYRENLLASLKLESEL